MNHTIEKPIAFPDNLFIKIMVIFAKFNIKKLHPKLLCKMQKYFMRGEGLEPSRLPIRPSNVRVCQFRHPRKQLTLSIISKVRSLSIGMGKKIRTAASRAENALISIGIQTLHRIGKGIFTVKLYLHFIISFTINNAGAKTLKYEKQI